MEIYYGVDRKAFAEVVSRPMISVRTMMKRKTPIVTNGKEWFMDSGAFTYLKNDGKFPFTYGKYLKIVAKFKPTYWANMDWCCEPTVLKSTGLSVLQHIGNTVENGRQLIDFDRDSFVMVLQGWTPRDYATCIDYCKDQGLITHTMGIGTICGRTDPKDVFEILKTIKFNLPDRVRIHCFGFSINLLKYKELFDKIDSIDTYAWCRPAGLNLSSKDYNNSYNRLALKLLSEYKEKVHKIVDLNNHQSLLENVT